MYEENARKLNAALAAINPAAVQDIIPLGQLDSMLQVQAGLDEGMVLGVLGDRTLGGDPTLRVPFLGADAAFPLGPMRLAAMLQAAGAVHERALSGRQPLRHPLRAAGRFHATSSATGRDAAIQSAVAAYAACLERHCRAAPYNWFNFFDFWRPKDAG